MGDEKLWCNKHTSQCGYSSKKRINCPNGGSAGFGKQDTCLMLHFARTMAQGLTLVNCKIYALKRCPVCSYSYFLDVWSTVTAGLRPQQSHSNHCIIHVLWYHSKAINMDSAEDHIKFLQNSPEVPKFALLWFWGCCTSDSNDLAGVLMCKPCISLLSELISLANCTEQFDCACAQNCLQTENRTSSLAFEGYLQMPARWSVFPSASPVTVCSWSWRQNRSKGMLKFAAQSTTREEPSSLFLCSAISIHSLNVHPGSKRALDWIYQATKILSSHADLMKALYTSEKVPIGSRNTNRRKA